MGIDLTTPEPIQFSSRDSDGYAFTVFTATYNRARTLHRVYDSLKVQTYRDFEWLIVDDGSQEDIYFLVKQWQEENLLPIRYFYKENGGKHTAFNRGVREARGKFFLNLDSDDGCVPEALEKFKYYWDTIPEIEKPHFSAVSSLCQDQNGIVVGSYLPHPIMDSNSLEMRYRYKLADEKWGFHLTEVLKKFPFPEDIQRTYIPETIIWHQIAREYQTRYINEPLRIFWMEGISQGYGGNPQRNATGRRLAHLIALNEEIDWFKVSPGSFIKSAINYSRNSFHLQISLLRQCLDLRNIFAQLLWIMNLPLGYLVYWLDKLGYLKG